MKHLEVRQLWVQEKVRDGKATVSWLSRCQNWANVLNHPCSASHMKEHLCYAGVEMRSELANSARGVVLATCAPRSSKRAFDPPHHESQSRVSWADLTEAENLE